MKKTKMPGVFRVQESEEINFGIFVDRKIKKILFLLFLVPPSCVNIAYAICVSKLFHDSIVPVKTF